MNVLSLFDGISCGQQALKNLGIKVDNYYACEVDQKSIQVTQHNFPDTIQMGDVTKLTASDLPKIDLVIGGSPCTGFSLAGKQLAFDDPRSALFFEFHRIVQEVKPKYFFLENNRMKKEYLEVIDEHMGVTSIQINSALVSAQNRIRHYWTNIPNATVPDNNNKMLKDIIGDYKGIWVYPRGFNKGGVQGYKGKCPTITTSSWEHNFKVAQLDGENRKFTPEECEVVQGLPIGYTSGISNAQRYKKIGNGWTVQVIEHIFQNLK